MPLNVTTGPPAAVAGSGPPGPVGPTDTGPATGNLAALFAALLIQQGQIAPIPLPKTTSAVPETTQETDIGKDDKTDLSDPQQPATQGQTDLTAINWAALAALQTPLPAQNALPTGNRPVSSAPTNSTEVMDTASLSIPAASAAKTDTPSGGLLPLSTVPQAQTDVLSTATVADSAATGFDAPASGLPSGETAATEISARVASSAASTSLLNTQPLPNALLGPTAPGGSVVSATQSVTPSAASAAGSVPMGTGMSLNVAVENIPALITPTPALPTTQQAVLAGAKLLTETAAQIALQNSGVPANNTGNTQASQGNQVASSDDPPVAAQAATTVEPTIGPLTLKPAKALHPLGRPGEQGLTLSQQSVLKSASQSVADDKSPQMDQGSDGKSDSSMDGATVLPQVTGASPTEPRVSTTGITDKPLTGAERAQIIQQTADGIGAVKPQVMATGQGQMTLHLHPKEWGDLQVTVQLAPAPAIDGVKQTAVVAHVVASSSVVKTALEKHSGDLNQALRETGLHLERLTVTVQAASAGEQSGGAAGDGRNFGQKTADQWQSAQSQTAAGNGGLGAESSSSFASYSQRQGGHGFQNPSASRSAYGGGDESDTERLPVSSGSSRLSAGFDQRV